MDGCGGWAKMGSAKKASENHQPRSYSNQINNKTKFIQQLKYQTRVSSFNFAPNLNRTMINSGNQNIASTAMPGQHIPPPGIKNSFAPLPPTVNLTADENGGKISESHSASKNAKEDVSMDDAEEAAKNAPPVNTFQKYDFNDLMNQFEGVSSKAMPTVELAQSLLMTTNLKEAAANMNTMQITNKAYHNGHQPFVSDQTNEALAPSKILTGGPASGDKVGSAVETVSTGAHYFYKQDYIADLSKKCATKDLTQVVKLLSNIGAADKSTNWFLEQRSLHRADATEGREIRDIIDKQVVDQSEYGRTKERIAETKQRTQQLLDQELSENEDKVEEPTPQVNQGTPVAEMETEEDSGQANKKQLLNERKISGIIKQIRENAKECLGPKDGQNYDHVSLFKICGKLRKDETYLKKRQEKHLNKLALNGKIDELKSELSQLEVAHANEGEKKDIRNKIQGIEYVLGLEKRMKADLMDKKISQLDLKPLNSEAFDIQNVLFDYCGVNLTGQLGEDVSEDSFSHQKRIERIFGKIRKLPRKSCLLANFDDQYFKKQTTKKDGKVKESQELVKVIGLEPDKLFDQIPKYRIQVEKMPKFSNNFDSIDSVMPGLTNKHSLAGQAIANPIASHMNFSRIDGRQVISLQFNPYFIQEDPEKKKIYDGYMREIIEQRDKIKNAPSDAKLKQEQANLKRAWQNIVKKDIPKAYRLYQKFKADQESNNKKLSQNCLKEVRKRAVKAQRLAKESVMRARKLTKEMCHYWRKRDKELADSKRKKEKMDKELKKKQQEEEEALLQKKRLEYLMQQSEIYAHFMATKLGVSEEHVNQKSGIDNKQHKRVEVDQRAARANVMNIINENRKRLDEFDDHDRDEVMEEDLHEHKFSNNQFNKTVEKPSIFLGDLKSYQLKGLQWLDNLYDQGINGILADEMGLGKTIQTIALLSHIAEKKNVWGPFLIVVPVTTLHNWQNELAKFCPELKVLPYFGSAEERKKLAKFLDPKNLYNPAMRIHVLITSYNLIVGGGKDQVRLQRVKWHYMILDEAQAIKNNASRRWKTLLNFNTRNRLLLSGTPIQNSMAELWALLHFIMPKLFDNHEQFQEWFSKDIEQHSMDQGELNKHQLKRLHLILQPFMLRRLKKDVEQEIAPKIEEIVQCDMTHRQKVLYDRIKSKISASDLFQLSSNKAKMENLMNLVMQFRKVCNHPDLFERRLGKIPFVFSKLHTGMQQNMLMASKPDITVLSSNPISFELPKMVFDECYMVTDNNTSLFTQFRKFLDPCFSTVSVETHFSLFNIFNTQNLHSEIYCSPPRKGFGSLFPILGLLLSSNQWSVGQLSYLLVADSMIQAVSLLHFYSQKKVRNDYLKINSSVKDQIDLAFGSYGAVYDDRTGSLNGRIDAMAFNFVCRDNEDVLYRSRVVENLDLKVSGEWAVLEPLVPDHPKEFLGYTRQLNKNVNIFYSKVIAEPPLMTCPSINFQRVYNSILNNPIAKKVLVGKNFKPKRNIYIGRIGRDRSSFLLKDDYTQGNQMYQLTPGPLSGYSLLNQGILSHNYQVKGSSTFQLPDYSRLVTDCSKMKILCDLLNKLHKGGHRCLIFCQMTRMMDILEDFLIWQKYSYFRMDGSTQLQDRRFMVEEFQSNPNIFIFILSTRAGGLGINLIAADTVIFYDNDWNPTMDSQATDRAHRIGQKKTVRVYRLVTKNTVEERILRRARQKESVQSTVYGANLKADQFSSRDVVDMIIDDIEDPLASLGGNRTQVKSFIKTAGQKKDSAKKKKKKNAQKGDRVYESVRRAECHDKYENEIDQLLNGSTDSKKVNGSKPDVEILNDQSSDDDNAQSEGSDVEMQEEFMDKKKLLLKMLDQQTGGGQQVFKFEEEDNPNGSAPHIKEQPAPKRKRGRPALQEPQLEDEDDDEEMEY